MPAYSIVVELYSIVHWPNADEHVLVIQCDCHIAGQLVEVEVCRTNACIYHLSNSTFMDGQQHGT